MPLVLLEGVDKSGKSTMAERVKVCWETRYGRAEIWHRGPVPDGKDPMQEYWSELPDPDLHELYILDRWHIGELVYGPIYRGGSKITLGDALRVQMAMKRRGLVPIYMTASYETVRSRFISDGEKFSKVEDITAILNGYHDVLKNFRDFWTIRSDQHIGPPMIQRIVESAATRGMQAKVKHG